MTREEAIQALTGYAGIGGTDEPSCDVTFRANIWDFVEAMRLAVAALREQEERSKGCDFCKGAKYIYGELSASGHVDDDHDFVHEQYGDLPICPMCGRRLEEV